MQPNALTVRRIQLGHSSNTSEDPMNRPRGVYSIDQILGTAGHQNQPDHHPRDRKCQYVN